MVSGINMRFLLPRLPKLGALLALCLPIVASAQAFIGDFSLSSGAVYQTASADAARGVAVDTVSGGGPYVYVTGESDAFGMTVKYSTSGVALATATFTSGATCYGHGVAVAPGGDVWVVGHEVTGGPVTNWVVQKHDSNLVFLASSVISGVTLGDAVATAIAFDGSGNAFVAGYSSNTGTGTDFRVMKYSSSLVVLASATLGGAGVDQANALALDASGNVIVTGLRSPSTYDWLTAKYNSSLVFLSSAVYDGGSGSDRAYGVTTDPSGNVYVTGESDSGGANYAFTTVKYNSSLGQTAVVSYNTGATDTGYGATFVGASTLVVVGSSFAGATEDWVIIEYDASLTQISSRAYDSGTSDRAYAVAKGTGTYMYVAGYSYTSPFGAFRTIRMNVSASGGGGGASPPIAPSGFVGTAQSTSTILWSWTDNASTELGFRVMAGPANVSGDLAANTTLWLQTGLTVNTSSGSLLVQAFNSTGTANSGALTRYSLADVPTGLGSLAVFQTSATVTWTAGNPAGTVFELERSTGGGFALAYSSITAAYTDTTLAAASTYYYQVRAFNGNALATAYASSITIVTSPTPVPLAATGFAGAAVSATTILWSWTDNTANELGYRVLSGTISLSGDLAVNATIWLQAGLSTNTAYGSYSAQAFNGGGTATSATALRTTLADAPAGLGIAGVYQTSGTLSWNAGGNPAGTTFELERSTGTGYGLQFTGSATTYFEQYLTPGATNFFRVRARNGEAVATAYASSISAVAFPAPPISGPTGTPVGVALGVSSVSWTWTLAAGATYHNLFRAADISYLGASAAGPFVQTVLAPNTPYGLRAAGVNLGGTGALSPSATVYTLAALPTGATVSSITATTMVPNWGLNGNPGSTVAQLERSTTGVVYSTVTAAAVASYADADLLGCTTYYYRVRNLNGDGFLTDYALFSGLTANTTPNPPAGLTAAANAGGTVSLAWNLSPGEGVTGYRLYWDGGSATVSYGAAIAVFGSTATAYTTGVLTSSASYTFALRAVHRCGVVETTGALAMSGAAVAPAAVRAAIKEPDSGKSINGNRVTILGELIAGAPSDVSQILFQYKSSASSVWINVTAANGNHPNPDFTFPYFMHWNVTGLAAGPYDLRALAYDLGGVPDAAPPAVQIVVNHINPVIAENDVNGKVRKDQDISNLVTSVVETAGAGALDPAVRVTIPAGAVNIATATVSVTANPTIATAAPAGQAMVGSAIKIDLSNGQTALNATAAITLTYPDTVLFPSLLQIYYLNEATGQWSRDFVSTVNTASRTVTGNTPHFSTFVLLLGTAFGASLDSVLVYPVPFKPNGPNADEGRPFTLGNPNSGIIFSSLVLGSEIKIYTLTGRLVASIDNPTIAGTVRWDARNQDGRDVASGAYFAVITAAGQKTVVKKLVIIR